MRFESNQRKRSCSNRKIIAVHAILFTFSLLMAGYTGIAKDEAGFRGVTFFRSRQRSKKNQKGLFRKSSGFLAQKKKGLRRKITGFSVQMRLEAKKTTTRSSPQISGVMVSHHNMVSPGGGLPSPPSYVTCRMDNRKLVNCYRNLVLSKKRSCYSWEPINFLACCRRLVAQFAGQC